MDEKRNKLAYRLTIKHYLEQIRMDWRTTVPGFLLTGVGTVFVAYIPPLIIAKLLSRYSSGNFPDVSDLIPYVVAFGGLWLLGELMWRIAIHLLIKAETRGMERLYTNAMNYMLKKDLSFFHDNFAGSLTKKTIGYSARYVDVMDNLIFNVTPYFIPAIFISVVLWQFSPILVLTLLGAMFVVLSLVFPLIRRRKKLVVLRETASNVVSGHISDIYSNIDAVRSFANETKEKKIYHKHVSDLTHKMKHSWDYQNQRIDMLISPFYVAINVLGLILALQIGKSSDASIEVVFVTFTYYAAITRFLWEFNGIYRRLEASLSDAAQFTELLLDEPKVQDVADPKPFVAIRGAIEFKNVTFDHEDADDSALFEKLNLRIRPGEKVGLVGHSGGGKSTLMKLIMRLTDIDSGDILIDGQNIAEAKQTKLRKYLSYVPQEPVMFHRTLSENIAYGKTDAAQQEIEIAAKRAHAHEFISSLPDGYNTLVGERGIKLSGGQRQRIAIARAMLKNAPILLLDEATSALDSESEKLIQDALWKLMENKTAIVIAHRLSTIQMMDRILVLENGEVVEEGTHKELLRNDGIYAELWAHQTGGFLED